MTITAYDECNHSENTHIHIHECVLCGAVITQSILPRIFYGGHPRVHQLMWDIGSICEFNLWFMFFVSHCRVIWNIVLQWTALKWHCNLLRLLFGPRGTSKIFSHQLLLNKQYSVCDPKMTITYVYILLYEVQMKYHSQWPISRAEPRFAPSQWETRYVVTTSLIGWMPAWNQPCFRYFGNSPGRLIANKTAAHVRSFLLLGQSLLQWFLAVSCAICAATYDQHFMSIILIV